MGSTLVGATASALAAGLFALALAALVATGLAGGFFAADFAGGAFFSTGAAAAFGLAGARRRAGTLGAATGVAVSASAAGAVVGLPTGASGSEADGLASSSGVTAGGGTVAAELVDAWVPVSLPGSMFSTIWCSPLSHGAGAFLPPCRLDFPRDRPGGWAFSRQNITVLPLKQGWTATRERHSRPVAVKMKHQASHRPTYIRTPNPARNPSPRPGLEVWARQQAMRRYR